MSLCCLYMGFFSIPLFNYSLVFKYLYEELQKNRPNLVKLANESEENDENIGEIIKTNEQCESIIDRYKQMFLGGGGGGGQASSSSPNWHDDKLVNINEDVIDDNDNEPSRRSVSNTSYDPLKELQDLFSHEPITTTAKSTVQKSADFSASLLGDSSATNNIESLLSSISVGQTIPSKSISSPNNIFAESVVAKSTKIFPVEESLIYLKKNRI